MPVDTTKTVRELAVELPYAPRVFEKLGIDFCCGGKRPLTEACNATGLALTDVVDQLEKAEHAIREGRESAARNWAKGSLGEVMDQIVTRHHLYVREEAPRIQQLFAKVASKHGDKHPELLHAREIFDALAGELMVHMMKEEQILFPYILRMEESQLSGEPVPPSCFGTVRNPIAMMCSEHDNAGELLKEIHTHTNDLKAPEDACISFQSLYRDLLAFEADLHQHIHLENNVLFPKALAMEGAEQS
jgi:regulator of cell morphogenesis and NO signaling